MQLTAYCRGVFTLTLDIGGTKLAAGLVDGDGALVHHTQAATPGGDAEAVWTALAGLIDDVLTRAGGRVRAVGIGSAGPIDVAAGTVSPINLTGWRRFPLVERVSTVLPGVPVRLGGDALCMALGEQWRGAGRDTRFVLGIVVSTGVGGGLVLDGTPYRGRTGNAGHVGHVVVDPQGATCSCGGRGCVETVASGPAMVRWARMNGWDAPPAADAEDLAVAAAAGIPVAVRAYRRGADALGAALASVAAVCDLDLVVIGGGVARSGPVLFDPLAEALRTYAGLSFLGSLRVVPARLGATAGLIGAAQLAMSAC